MTTNEAIAQNLQTAAAKALRAEIAALPVAYLKRIGMDSPEAVEAYIAAEVA